MNAMNEMIIYTLRINIYSSQNILNEGDGYLKQGRCCYLIQRHVGEME